MKSLPFEPFKIKVVEKINITTRNYREARMAEANYNPFALKAKDVTIDLLTDSGTTAMSHTQWGALMIGDESYAGSDSYFRFQDAVGEITGKKFIFPTHQGRSAENIFFSSVLKKGDIVPNNTHFDTTGANVSHKGGVALNLPVKQFADLESDYPFKGDIDLEALEKTIEEHGSARIPVVFITVTNNSAGGQPVSMGNIRAAKELCDKHDIPLYLDCARFAENCYFIKKREPGYSKKSIKAIAKEMFSYADGALMSAKKDALVNIGGFLATNDEKIAQRVSEIMVVIEGFVTYGGLAGRDMDAIATGLEEGLDEQYLESRIGQIAYLGDQLQQKGVPILLPTGGHAIYIDVKRFLPEMALEKLPAWALTCEAYLEGGVRTVEIGSVMFAEEDPKTGQIVYPQLELVRLAVPRRVYTNRHMDYVADVFGNLVSKKESIRGVRYTYCPERLRHFLARFEPL